MTLVSDARVLWLKRRVSMKLAQLEKSSDVDHHHINMTLQQGGSVDPIFRTHD